MSLGRKEVGKEFQSPCRNGGNGELGMCHFFLLSESQNTIIIFRLEDKLEVD